MPTDQEISKKINIHSLPRLNLKAYWVINELSSPITDRFSAAQVAKYLIETATISTSRQAVEQALSKPKGFCHKDKRGFKLMQPGLDELNKHLSQSPANDGTAVFIDCNKPFSAKNYILKNILGSGHKEIMLCDPYIDQNTLDVIYTNFEKGIPIKILSSKIQDKPTGTFKRQLVELVNEGFDVEVRLYASSVLHDRYIMSEKDFWLSGNSLNFLGKKESFLVMLGNDIRQSMLTTFNSRWKASQPF